LRERLREREREIERERERERERSWEEKRKPPPKSSCAVQWAKERGKRRSIDFERERNIMSVPRAQTTAGGIPPVSATAGQRMTVFIQPSKSNDLEHYSKNYIYPKKVLVGLGILEIGVPISIFLIVSLIEPL
jgi:hypothetical protein